MIIPAPSTLNLEQQVTKKKRPVDLIKPLEDSDTRRAPPGRLAQEANVPPPPPPPPQPGKRGEKPSLSKLFVLLSSLSVVFS